MKKSHTTNHNRRVVITALGIITAIGETVPAFTEGLFNGKCGIGPVTIFDTKDFPCQQAAQVKKENLETQFKPKEIKRVSRCDLLGLIAAKEAISNVGLELKKLSTDRISVIMGGGAGGVRSWEQHRRAIWSGDQRPAPSLLFPYSACTLTDLIANTYKITGPRSTITTACSSSTTSIGYGFDLIQNNTCDIAITGGAESLTELTFSGFNSLRVMDPEYCRPFDKNRQGLSLGEGAAVIILEEYEHAINRNADIFAEVLGYAINADAYHMTSPDPGGKGMGNVMSSALKNSDITTDDIDYINAHGTATKANDKAETMAIKKVFGPDKAEKLAISSTKSMVGHCLGASGAIEAGAAILSLTQQTVPPTIHLNEPDPDCDLDYVPNKARPMNITIAMSNSFAFGGNNSCIIFKKI